MSRPGSAALVAAVPGVLATFPERLVDALTRPITGDDAVLTARIAIDRHARLADVVAAITELAAADPSVERVEIEIAQIR